MRLHCGTRRMAESAALLVDEVLPQQPIRQWVLSVLFQLRFLLASQPSIVGGMTTYQAQGIIRGLNGLNFIGGDLVEVAPPFDVGGVTSLVGATLMFEILCVLAEAVARKQSSEVDG